MRRQLRWLALGATLIGAGLVQIGSGPVESACKRVVGQRLKCAGMRWGEPGSDGVCHLRALFLSEKGQWDAYWAEHRGAA